MIGVYFYLIKNKHTTIKRAIEYFKLNCSELVVKRRLSEKYGAKEIASIIKCGNSSKPEMEFFHTLCFFFGKKNIKRQFKINGYNYSYDFLLHDKIIIEYDGEYWHSFHTERDKMKDEIALNHRYIMIRVADAKSKDLVIWKMIKDKIDEIQIQKN